ncbi:MAG TPA: glycosyltransferase [Opitutaceae bacterium]|jgi:hypothetical protein
MNPPKDQPAGGPRISAVIPAHNPDAGRLGKTLAALKEQELPASDFEVIVVDNASSSFPSAAFFADCAPKGTAVVLEKTLGLTAARIAGFAASRGDVVVLVDDDNVLASDYLAQALAIARDFPFLGSWSGNVELVFDPGAVPPPLLWRDFLTERRCEKAVWSNDPSHHDSTPWGAGMCIRRPVADGYAERCALESSRLRLDLSGSQLVYGGDTDIAYFGCSMGLGKGVFPQLRVRHLIPRERCERSYLLRVAEGRAYSEVLHHWVLRGAVPTEPADAASRVRRLVRTALMDGNMRATERARSAGRRRAMRELSP